MSEHALRLAVVLPLLLLLLGGVLVATKRGLIRLPGVQHGEAPLRLMQVVALGPGTKLAVAEFAGARLLIGVGKDGVRLLADGRLDALAPTPDLSLKTEGSSVPLPAREGPGETAQPAPGVGATAASCAR